jgi:uncharacterized protein YecE (DUF72 family)
MHEGGASPHPCYDQAALRSVAAELSETFSKGEDVYVYFNNDSGGCAVRNARSLRNLLQDGPAD